MSILSVFHASSAHLLGKVLTHHEDVVTTLAEQGVRFERWDSGVSLRPGTPSQAVLEQCAATLDGLQGAYHCQAVRLLNCDGVDATTAGLRDEHVHPVDEVLTVLGGRVQVAMRLADQVLSVLCEKGDLVRIPAGVARWFELGERPFCLALRLFEHERGVMPRFTGNAQAREFPGIDEL